MEEEELRVISGLKERAIEQFEDLLSENEKTKDEFDKVKQERDEAVRKLEEFNKISHLVIEEVSFMQSNLEIEKSCRESAEALASKLNKENKNLKRISMLYMAKLGPDVLTEEIRLDDDEDPTPDGQGVCTDPNCQQKVKGLQEEVLSVQEQKKSVSIELEELRSRLVDFIEEVNSTKKENVLLTKEVFDQRKLLEKYNRVSVLAVEEYEDLQNSLEMEKDLRERAEQLAQEMIIEQNKLKRQSCLLLQQCAPSETLLNALQENARLTQLLEEERIVHQHKVKELEDLLAEDRLRKEIESLRKELEIMEDEKKDVEAKLQGAQSSIRDLKHSVEELQKRVHQAENPAPPPPPPPPPLPPPPPANPIRSLMSIIRKKPSSSAKKEVASQPDSGNADDLKRQAVEEMMNRIKKGVHLRPVQQTVRVKQEPPVAAAAAAPPAGCEEEATTKPVEVKSQSSAVQELRTMVDTLNSSGSRRRSGAISTASTETELQRILRRRKVTTDQDASARPLTSTESKSMPLLGAATAKPLSQRERNAESGTASAGTQDGAKTQHIKQTSQSAETLRGAAQKAEPPPDALPGAAEKAELPGDSLPGAAEKAEPPGDALGIALQAAENGDSQQVNGEAAAVMRRGRKDEDSSNC